MLNVRATISSMRGESFLIIYHNPSSLKLYLLKRAQQNKRNETQNPKKFLHFAHTYLWLYYTNFCSKLQVPANFYAFAELSRAFIDISSKIAYFSVIFLRYIYNHFYTDNM